MISTVLRRSFLGTSRCTSAASLASINAVLFHHLSPAAATISDLAANGPTSDKSSFSPAPPSNQFGVKARNFHVKSVPSEFRASMVAPDYADSYESSDGGNGDSEMAVSSSSGGDGLAISELGISPEIVNASKGRGYATVRESSVGDSASVSNGIKKSEVPIPKNVIPLSRKAITKQKEGEESTSKIKGTKICIGIRSFDNPEKQAWCLPPHSRKVAMPDTRVLYTVLRSPHVDKKSREQFEMRFKKRFLVIKAQSHELSNKLFWLKRYRILGAQYELQFHCKTRFDMTPVLASSIKGQ